LEGLTRDHVEGITRDQLWAKPRLTFEPGAGFHQACSMSARRLLDICSIFAISLIQFS